MVSFIKKEYKNIPFRFWLSKTVDRTLDKKDYFKQYLEYNRAYDKWFKHAITYKNNKQLKQKSENNSALKFFFFCLSAFFSIIFFFLSFQVKEESKIIIGWITGILVFLSILFFFMFVFSPEKDDEIELEKIKNKYPVFNDLSISSPFNKELFLQYFHINENDNTTGIALNIMSYYFFKKDLIIHLPKVFLNEERISFVRLTEILKTIYQNNQYNDIVIQIEKWVNGIEKVHEHGLIYVFEEDDEIHKIIDEICEIDKEMLNEQNKKMCFNKWAEKAESEKKKYLNEVQVLQQLTHNKTQFVKENQYKIKNFEFDDFNSLRHLNEKEIERYFNQIIHNIQHETQLLKENNENLFKQIQKRLKQ